VPASAHLDVTAEADQASAGSRRRRKEASFGENAIFNVLGWLAPGIAAFVCAPITVRGLGPDLYGLLVLVGAMTGYLDLLDMGLGGALIRYISFYRALEQGRPMVAIVRVAVFWFGAAGVAAAAILFIAAPWLATDLLHVSPELLPTAETAIRISAVDVVVALMLSVGTAIPLGFLRYDIAAAMTAVFGTASWVGPAIIVKLGFGVIAVVSFYLASNIIALLLYAYYGRVLFRSVHRDSGPRWREIRREVLSFAGLLAANRIGSTVASQTNRLMVGITDGTAAAGYYQVPSVLATKMYELLSKIAQVLFPTGAALIAREQHDELRTLYMRSSRLLFVLDASMAAPIAVFAYPLLQYWVSPLYAEKGSLALSVFATTQAINGAALAVGFLSWAAGRAGVNLLFATVSSAISLATIYPLATHFGVVGGAAAGLCGALTTPFFIHWVDRRILKLSSWMVFRRCYLPSILGTAGAALVSHFLLVPLAHGLFTTFALLALGALLSLCLSGLAGAITRDDLRTLAGLLGSLWHRLVRVRS
jgi:O-antigen/teichoic acid export membrane protein